MNSKIIYASILIVAMLACMVLAAQDEMSSASASDSASSSSNSDSSLSSSQQGGQGGQDGSSGSASADADGQQNCPRSKAMGYMQSMQSMLNKYRPQSKSQSSGQANSGLSRRKRQATDGQNNNLPAPELNYRPAGGQQQSPSRQQNPSAANGDQSPGTTDATELAKQEGRLRMLLRRLMNNRMMPSLDKMIQVLTVLITLALMSLIGPVAGANAPMIQGLVNKVVPIIVSSLLRYAIQQPEAHAVAKQLGDPITLLPLEPVPASQSRFRQLI